ncbi:hypothetical protein BpOF4_20014 (plasmid) [Alkalihalophilus pseudofirmus OF4]|uniref:YolD-like protein n=1 Tax=Alkalihalophilus pseudofirmus (strain ATCC BAA-2126 / JCM 17055 / OF4) TaxID=398511 RepID=D3G0X6_ALKPO|nr:YolD-like family protein [Alkalihalophilus pseudofirmus]ADC52002.1 hypothetical protein BpOF4_20014 [Alkalihalophilus pseudofirmus OF4]
MQYRGMIKWTQMAIPEHIEMIRREREEKKRPIRPKLDEQELSEIGYLIEEKMRYGEPATIYYWDLESVQSVTGTISEKPGMKQKLSILTEDDIRVRIEYSSILKVN